MTLMREKEWEREGQMRGARDWPGTILMNEKEETIGKGPSPLPAPSRSRKGQLVSTELVICSSIFLAALIIFLLVWSAISSAYRDEQANRDMQVELTGISDMAVLSPGDPPDWEMTAPTNASAFGFAQSPNVLSPAKLSALALLNQTYVISKERMGAGKYGLFITVLDANGGQLPYGFGEQVTASNGSIVSFSAERLALLGGTPVRLVVQIWRNKYFSPT